MKDETNLFFSYLYTLVSKNSKAKWLLFVFKHAEYKKRRESFEVAIMHVFCLTHEDVFRMQRAESWFIPIVSMFRTWWENNREKCERKKTNL